MYIVHVFLNVEEKYIHEFKDATIKNAQHSLKEEGVKKFDILQEQENPRCFLLYEIYDSEQAQALHRETDHFKEWKSTTTKMMAEPFKVIKYNNVFL